MKNKAKPCLCLPMRKTKPFNEDPVPGCKGKGSLHLAALVSFDTDREADESASEVCHEFVVWFMAGNQCKAYSCLVSYCSSGRISRYIFEPKSYAFKDDRAIQMKQAG